MKNILKKFLVSVAILFMFCAPTFAFAVEKEDGGGLIPCGLTNKELKKDPATGQVTGGQINVPCTFDHVLVLINNVVNFLLFKLAVPLAAIVFVYAGVQLITSGGSSEGMQKAKAIFTSTAMGLILAVAAWLIIHTLLTIVGYDGSWIGL